MGLETILGSTLINAGIIAMLLILLAKFF